MSEIERLRALRDAYFDDPTADRLADLNEAAFVALPALLDEQDALREVLTEAIGQLQADPNGYHHCRWCSGVDSHTDYCSWVARNERIAAIRDTARGALARLNGAS